MTKKVTMSRVGYHDHRRPDLNLAEELGDREFKNIKQFGRFEKVPLEDELCTEISFIATKS